MLLTKLIHWRPGNITALQLFQLIRFGSLLLISILLSKSGLTTESIGLYESVLFLAGLISFFWLTGYIQSFLASYHDFSGKGKHPSIFNAALILFGFALIAVIILFVTGKSTSLEITKTNSGTIFPLLLAYVLFSAPSSLIEYIYLLQSKPKKLISYGIISYALQIALVCIPLLMYSAIEYSIAGLLLSAVLRFIWLLILIKRHSEYQFNPSFIISSLQTAWPLILLALVGGSTTYIDSSVVSAYFDQASFAIFRYGARELPFVVLFANAFSNAMVPEFAKPQRLKEKLGEMKIKSTRMAHFFFPITFILILTSSYFFPLIFNPDFLESAKIFNVYLLIISSRLVFPQTILYGFRDNRPVLLIGIFALATHLAISLSLVTYYGIVGVAFAAVVANLIDKALLAGYLYRKHKIGIAEYLDIKWWVIYNSILIAIYLYLS